MDVCRRTTAFSRTSSAGAVGALVVHDRAASDKGGV